MQLTIDASEKLQEKKRSLIERANNGNASAQFKLAQWYFFEEKCTIESGEYPKETKEKMELAMALLEKAASKNHKLAIYSLGKCYCEGAICEKNHKLAFELFMQAAVNGCDRAQYEVSECYENGIGVEKSLESSSFWLAKSAQKFNIYAKNKLALKYYYGIYAEINYLKAVECMRDIAYKKIAAKYNQYGCCRFQTNFKEIGKQCQIQYLLGKCYEKGRGVEQSDCKAVELYKKAVRNGYWQAIRALGECYASGKGIKQNLVKAKKLLDIVENIKGQVENGNNANINQVDSYCRECLLGFKF